MKRPGCYKIITVGDPGVGKTSLLEKYCNNKSIQLSAGYKSTIGADFMTKKLEVNNSPVILHIWDTAGQERFLALCVAFYRGSDAAVLVYDVTNSKTIDSLEKWLEEVYKHCNPTSLEEFPIYVIGNKIDDPLPEVQENKALAEKFCKTKRLKHVCVSALTSENVENVFYQIALEINNLEKLQKIEIPEKQEIEILNEVQPKTIKPPSHRVSLMPKDETPQTKSPCCG